ncbi:hypothetical protein SAMN04244579_04298 [Azotobacter beijerinckii]|uniref:Uncharacterized protein n=1 Tax=Azotobacter beijerinckii TaxID=170623 RepID=A0A1H6YRD7_9GAMM|nr:hypothetical protein SAMN04244579_04298 [Azotobacter beijerinckii]
MRDAVLGRFERQAPASVMAPLALERAMPAAWVDEVFEAHRQRQYPRELLFSTVVELMSLVSSGLRPSLHAAARRRTPDGQPARMPGHSLVVYDPDLDLVTDLAACEDAYESERTGVQLWMADRHFCIRTILQSFQQARARFHRAPGCRASVHRSSGTLARPGQGGNRLGTRTGHPGGEGSGALTPHRAVLGAADGVGRVRALAVE